MKEIPKKDLRTLWRRVSLIGWSEEWFYKWLTDNYPKPNKNTRLHDLTKVQFYEMLGLLSKMQVQGNGLSVDAYDKLFALAFQITKDSTRCTHYLSTVCKDKAGIDDPKRLNGQQYRKVFEALKAAKQWRDKRG